MKRVGYLICLVVGLLAGYVTCLLVAQAASPSDGKSLPDKLLDVTLEHVKTKGPDADAARFVSVSGQAAWQRREEFVGLTAPYLQNKDPAKVAGAIEVLYRFRGHRPMISHGDFEKDNAEFFSRLDKLVYAGFGHFHVLADDRVYHSLALFLGVSPSRESKRELLKIAAQTPEKEQALICLAWHRDPGDMEALFPYMLEDSPAARSLPYHFRNAYAEASIPYLKRALKESKSASARLKAAFELVRLRVPGGFQHLANVARRNPKPEGLRPPHLDLVRQFAIDYLELPRDASTQEDIAAHIEKKQSQLCQAQR